MPIFIVRLVEESGCSITGGPTPTGRRVEASASRSCTSWRARSRSTPRLKMSSICDIAITDRDRITSRSGVPLRISSIGMVMSSSTSAVDMPMPSVWISTFGGANSGKTSTGMWRIRSIPRATIATATAMTMNRNFRLEPIIQRNMAEDAFQQIDRQNPTALDPLWPRSQPVQGLLHLLSILGFHAPQLCRPPRHDRGAGGRSLLEDGSIAGDVVDLDRMPDESEGLR